MDSSLDCSALLPPFSLPCPIYRAHGISHGPTLALQPPPIDPMAGEETLFAYDLPTVHFPAESGTREGLVGAPELQWLSEPSEVPNLPPLARAVGPWDHVGGTKLRYIRGTSSAPPPLHTGGCPKATCARCQRHVCMQHTAGKSLENLTSSHTSSCMILMPLDIRCQEPHVSLAAIDTAIEMLQWPCNEMPYGTQHHSAPSPSPCTCAAVRGAVGPALGQSHGPALAPQPLPIDPMQIDPMAVEETPFARDLLTMHFWAGSAPLEGLGGAQSEPQWQSEPSEVPTVLPD